MLHFLHKEESLKDHSSLQTTRYDTMSVLLKQVIMNK